MAIIAAVVAFFGLISASVFDLAYHGPFIIFGGFKYATTNRLVLTVS